MKLPDGDIHVVIWQPGQLDPTSMPRAQSDGVETVGKELVRDYRVVPYVGRDTKICPHCAAALDKHISAHGHKYLSRHIQPVRALDSISSLGFIPQRT